MDCPQLGSRLLTCPGGSFGKVFKAIDRTTGETVAIKHIDLEDSSEELADIQAEISLLSTCHSPYITEYKTSFVKGVKLWIVMEYLGGGSAADLVCRLTDGHELHELTVAVGTRNFQRSPHRHHLPRTPAWTRLPTFHRQDSSGHQGRQRTTHRPGQSQAR